MDYYKQYRETENKYKELNLDSDNKLKTNNDVKYILGFNIQDTTGYSQLTLENKLLVEHLIIDYLNRWGLMDRLSKKPIKIEFHTDKFKVWFSSPNNFSYLYLDGRIG